MSVKQLAKRGCCKLQVILAQNSRTFVAFDWTYQFFLYMKKHFSLFWLDISIFSPVKNTVCSSDWLELICVWKFTSMTIEFFSEYLSIRASDRSRKRKSNFAGFLGTNSRKNRPIRRNFVGLFGANFTKKWSVKNGWFCGYFQGKFR